MEHDGAMRRCLCQSLAFLMLGKWRISRSPFGVLGLRGSSRVSPAAQWASCADCLHTVHLRRLVLGYLIGAALSRCEPGQDLHAAVRCRNSCWTWEWKRSRGKTSSEWLCPGPTISTMRSQG